ncbi:MAG TPA: hypothetical protein VN739_10120 [Nitrososphaerales archaeon]|nr:hypothetical protein [Nitrososphaerales archaeon]
MKPARLLLSLVGLVAIGLAYKTGNLDFLFIAIAALFGGLYLMGALSRSGQQDDENKTNSKDKSSKDKNRSQL